MGFNLFKKRKKIDISEWEFKMLISIAKVLPSKYSFLERQLNRDFLLGSQKNDFINEGWKITICNHKKYDIYRNLDINYKLIGIKIHAIDYENIVEVELDLYEGILIGYRIDLEDRNFDIERIDVNNLKEIPYNNIDYNELKKILGNVDEDIQSKLNLNDTLKIEYENRIYYTIKEFGDGDYLAIDTDCIIYGMIHDPFEIEVLFKTKEEFFKAIKSGIFKMQDYYDKKTS